MIFLLDNRNLLKNYESMEIYGMLDLIAMQIFFWFKDLTDEFTKNWIHGPNMLMMAGLDVIYSCQ